MPDAAWGLEARNESRPKFQTSETYGEVGNEANLHRKEGKSVERELDSAFPVPEAARTMRGQFAASLEPPVQCGGQTCTEPARRQGRELRHATVQTGESQRRQRGPGVCVFDLSCYGERFKMHPC